MGLVSIIVFSKSQLRDSTRFAKEKLTKGFNWCLCEKNRKKERKKEREYIYRVYNDWDWKKERKKQLVISLIVITSFANINAAYEIILIILSNNEYIY